MRNKTLELVYILDESGSMDHLTDDTIGSFNSNLSKHKEEDFKALVTTVLFNTEFKTVHDRLLVKDVQPLTRKEYCASGCTALYDAVGMTIRHIEEIHRYIRPEDIPDRVLFVIITDGLENSSSEFSGDQVREMVKNKKEAGWDFLFIGAGIDAPVAAEDIGISRGASATIRRCAADISKGMRFAREVSCMDISPAREYMAFEKMAEEARKKILEDDGNKLPF